MESRRGLRFRPPGITGAAESSLPDSRDPGHRRKRARVPTNTESIFDRLVDDTAALFSALAVVVAVSVVGVRKLGARPLATQFPRLTAIIELGVGPPTVLTALRQLDLTNAYSDQELERNASASRYQTFDAGTVVLREGAVADAFHVIVSGVVASSIALPDGVQQAVEQLRPGEYFGISSMTTCEPSSLQFTAQTEVTTIRVDVDCLRSVLAANPGHADHLAAIVKRRMDKAQAVRASRQRPAPSLTPVRRGSVASERTKRLAKTEAFDSYDRAGKS